MKPDARCPGVPRLTDRSTVAVLLELCRGTIVEAEAALACSSTVEVFMMERTLSKVFVSSQARS